MGQDNPNVKQLILAFGEGALSADFPTGENAPVVILDHNGITKFLPTIYGAGGKKIPIKTGYKYVMDHFLKLPLASFFKGAKTVYIILDRGAPPNKSAEHASRYSKVVADVTPQDYPSSDALMNDFTMPEDSSETGWKNFMKNKDLKARMLHYVTARLIGRSGKISKDLRRLLRGTHEGDYDWSLPDFTLNAGEDCVMYLHGGRTVMPLPGGLGGTEHPDPFLLEFRTSVVDVEKRKEEKRRRKEIRNEQKMGIVARRSFNGEIDVDAAVEEYDEDARACKNMQATKGLQVERSVKISGDYDPTVIKNLLEGEMAAFYYANRHASKGHPVAIVTSDLDVLLMALKGCPDRMGRDGVFCNDMYVKLVVPGNRSAKTVTVPGNYSAKTVTINVNVLWKNMNYVRPVRFAPFDAEKDDLKSKESVLNSEAFDIQNDSTEWVTQLCTSTFLCGSDYVKGYCKGIANRTGGFREEELDTFFSFGGNAGSAEDKKRALKTRENLSKLSHVPWCIYVFLQKYETFKSMITVERPGRLLPETPHCVLSSSKVDVKERFFADYTWEIYMCVHAIQGRSSGKYREKYGENYSIENLRKFLDPSEEEEGKTRTKRKTSARKKPIADTRLPDIESCILTQRHLLWALNYYMNGHKGSCHLVDPTTLYRGMPYYGWTFDRNGLCVTSKRVSPGIQKGDARYLRELESEKKIAMGKLNECSRKNYDDGSKDIFEGGTKSSSKVTVRKR